jgi:ComF family protein
VNPRSAIDTLMARVAEAFGASETRCQCCGALATKIPGELPLCPECARELRLRTGGYCPRCGAIFADETAAPHLCAACLRSPPPYERLTFFAAYAPPLDECILSFKFAAALSRQNLLCAMLHAAFARLGPPVPDVVVPVPLHERRLRERGFNQSLELARGLAGRTGIGLAATALSRLRDTVPQARLERAERLLNLKGAFAADPRQVAGRRVLLVDDVSTTGATLVECTAALLAAGAATVDVAVLARTAEPDMRAEPVSR